MESQDKGKVAQEGFQRPREVPFTLLSLEVDLDPGWYLEDLGPILEVLDPIVITI